MTISELVNAKNSKCWRKKTQNNEGPGPDYGGKISQWSGINNPGWEDYRKRDFDPENPEITLNNRREAIEYIEEIESTVTSLHREAEAQFRPELEKIVSGIETGFRGTALYATENIAGRINARPEDEGFTVKNQFSGSQSVTDPARGKNKSECAYGGKNGDRHPSPSAEWRMGNRLSMVWHQ